MEKTPGFAAKLASLRILVFDEADHLLDMGFMLSINKILSRLPPKGTRQTLLFSATVPTSTEKLAQTFLRPGNHFVDTVGKESVQTHEHVKQELVISSLFDIIPSILSIMRRESQVTDYKIIVFFATARVAGFMAELFQEMGLNVLEMHSRINQNARARTASLFKESKNVILFSSDGK